MMPGRTGASNSVFRDDTTKTLQTQSGTLSNPILGGGHHDYSRTAYLNWEPRSRLDPNEAVLIALDGMVQVVR